MLILSDWSRKSDRSDRNMWQIDAVNNIIRKAFQLSVPLIGHVIIHFNEDSVISEREAHFE